MTGPGGSQPSMMPGTDGPPKTDGPPITDGPPKTDGPAITDGPPKTDGPAMNMTTSSGCQCGIKRKGTEKKNPKIVGGSNAEVNEWPWMAAISFSSWGAGQAYGCGAALINNKYLVSAAHCFFNEDGSKVEWSDITIVLGDHDKSSDTETYKAVYTVKFVVTHQNYNPTTYENDIAVIKINGLMNNPEIQEVDLNEVSPVCLPTKSGYTGFGWVYGWGTLEADGEQPDILQEIALPLVGNDVCAEAMQSTGTQIVDGMLCAGGDEGKDSCQGDSGGPMTVDNNGKQELIGAVSFGIGCAEGGLYGVYADVYYYLDWINGVVEGEGGAEYCPDFKWGP